VSGSANLIEFNVKQKISAALHRSAHVDANDIHVTVIGGKMRLDGKVKAWHACGTVEHAAWSAPGATQAEDNLTVS
jgi:osmotically-inducible protein OsmY